MRTLILQYLDNQRRRALRNPKLNSTVNLAPFLADKFPGADLKGLKSLLNSMNEENVINVSGDYGSLGASFGGVRKDLSSTVIHAAIQPKGIAEVEKLVPEAPTLFEVPSVPVAPEEIISAAPSVPEETPLTDEQLKALQDITNHIAPPSVSEESPE